MIRRATASFTAAAMLIVACAFQADAAPDPVVAARLFQEAKQISDRDGGRFWGKPLYGPILFVDPTDLGAVANEADGQGVLKPTGSVLTGRMPEDWAVSSTPIEWMGRRWTELYWPLMGLPDAEAKVGDDWLAVSLAHEMFHRIQPSLGLTRPEAANVQLDTLEGRYLIQLEWRALAAALSTTDPTARRRAIADAVLFRAERYRRFPEAVKSEAALEINEGIPEYTGVRLGLATPEARVRYALYDLAAWAQVPSFVRSFAYATGPAYGLLLDQADPAWRSKLNSGPGLDQLLAKAADIASLPAAELSSREDVYDVGGRLQNAEARRDEARRSQLAALKASLVDGPVLRIPLRKADYAFSPQSLLPLGDYGVVYPTLKLSDEWGRLVVDHGGALLDKDMTIAVVSAANSKGLTGEGWRLSLKDGWSVQPGARAGDLIVVRAKP